jgi:hypothetical protein
MDNEVTTSLCRVWQSGLTGRGGSIGAIKVDAVRISWIRLAFRFTLGVNPIDGYCLFQ